MGIAQYTLNRKKIVSRRQKEILLKKKLLALVSPQMETDISIIAQLDKTRNSISTAKIIKQPFHLA